MDVFVIIIIGMTIISRSIGVGIVLRSRSLIPWTITWRWPRMSWRLG